jgi:hypothetical protein
MKNIIKNEYQKIIASFMMVLASLMSLAQDKGVDVDVNVNKDSNWYQQPWVWILGGAVFILLLAAILRSGRSSAD